MPKDSLFSTASIKLMNMGVGEGIKFYAKMNSKSGLRKDKMGKDRNIILPMIKISDGYIHPVTPALTRTIIFSVSSGMQKFHCTSEDIDLNTVIGSETDLIPKTTLAAIRTQIDESKRAIVEAEIMIKDAQARLDWCTANSFSDYDEAIYDAAMLIESMRDSKESPADVAAKLVKMMRQ